MTLKQWNAVLQYADEIANRLSAKGIPTKANAYSMYDGSRGIELTVYDVRGDVYMSPASGIHKSHEEMLHALENIAKRIERECL